VTFTASDRREPTDLPSLFCHAFWAGETRKFFGVQKVFIIRQAGKGPSVADICWNPGIRQATHRDLPTMGAIAVSFDIRKFKQQRCSGVQSGQDLSCDTLAARLPPNRSAHRKAKLRAQLLVFVNIFLFLFQLRFLLWIPLSIPKISDFYHIQ
jgi:hypothetical protein